MSVLFCTEETTKYKLSLLQRTEGERLKPREGTYPKVLALTVSTLGLGPSLLSSHSLTAK